MNSDLKRLYTTTAVGSVLLSLASVAHADTVLDFVGKGLSLEVSGADSTVQVAQGLMNEAGEAALADAIKSALATNYALLNQSFADSADPGILYNPTNWAPIAAIADTFANISYQSAAATNAASESNSANVTSTADESVLTGLQNGESNAMTLSQSEVQNTMNVFQDGVSGVMTVNQGGSTAGHGNAAAVGQKGELATAEVNQFGGDNTLSVMQYNVADQGVALAASNASVRQDGDLNSLSLVLEGSTSTWVNALGDTIVGVEAAQTGDSNTAIMAISGAGNGLSLNQAKSGAVLDLYVFGDNNTGVVNQTAAAVANVNIDSSGTSFSINQSVAGATATMNFNGIENTGATITQTADSTATISVDGSYNAVGGIVQGAANQTAEIYINGDNNTSNVDQDATAAGATATLNTVGDSNSGFVSQSAGATVTADIDGNASTYSVTQLVAAIADLDVVGTNNDTTIFQGVGATGASATVDIYGNNNIVDIEQTGLGAIASLYIAPDNGNSGNSNNIALTQGGDNTVATINVYEQSNSATIVQNGNGGQSVATFTGANNNMWITQTETAASSYANISIAGTNNDATINQSAAGTSATINIESTAVNNDIIVNQSVDTASALVTVSGDRNTFTLSQASSSISVVADVDGKRQTTVLQQ